MNYGLKTDLESWISQLNDISNQMLISLSKRLIQDPEEKTPIESLTELERLFDSLEDVISGCKEIKDN